MSKRNAKEFKQIKRELWTKIDDIYTQEAYDIVYNYIMKGEVPKYD